MIRILDSIDNPSSLKGLSIVELEQLAGEIREEICDVVSRNGGHLAPNLGVVELSIALHASLDCPKDKIIWDVGHQSYTHKILTGRRKEFHSLRKEGGISGFPRITESKYDSFGTGHAATAISAALGLAVARDLNGTDEKIVAIVGDGAMTAGLCFEGINNAGASGRDLLVILNDNKMSISPSVGALANHFLDVISAKTYNKLKKDIWDLTGFMPAIGQPVRTILNRVEKSLKTLIVPGSWFENLGFRYFGPVDGHDIGRLMQILTQLKSVKGPLLLHLYTTKGRGYDYAEKDSKKFHGISAFELENGKTIKTTNRPSYSKVFGETLVCLALKKPDICAITAAMTDSTGLTIFSEKFPERFFDVGIAEGHAVTFAAGLASAGLKPFVAVYSTFLQRTYDNIIHDVALQNLPVVFCIDRAGFVGQDGPTHHGVLDISYMRQIPGIVVMAPRNENELRDMMNFAADYNDGPVSIRYPRGSGTAVHIKDTFNSIELGRAEILCEGKAATILAIGEVVSAAVEAAQILSLEGIRVTVVNMRFVCPLDTQLLDKIIKKRAPIITVEENSIAGGFGSAVSEYYTGKNIHSRITIIGIPATFVDHAKRSRLISLYGLDAESIAETVKKAVAK